MNWWIERQKKDIFVKKRKAENYHSRAAFKLIDLIEKYQLKKHIQGPVVDLGAAPGGWTQILRHNFPKQKVVACDLLPLEPVDNISFIQGDFTSAEVQEILVQILGTEKVHAVFSDMAPNLSGHPLVDHGKLEYLADHVLEFARKTLKHKGWLIQKIFHGPSFEIIIKNYRPYFRKISFFKPPASRKESAEIYMIAEDFKSDNKN